MTEKKVILYERNFATKEEYLEATSYIEKKNILTAARREIPSYLQRSGFTMYESLRYRYIALYQDPDYDLHAKAQKAISDLLLTQYGEVDGFVSNSEIIREDLGVISEELRLYAAFERHTIMNLAGNEYLFTSENRYYAEWNAMLLYTTKNYAPGYIPDTERYHSIGRTDQSLRVFRTYGIPEITVARRIVNDHREYANKHVIADYLAKVNSCVGNLDLDVFMV